MTLKKARSGTIRAKAAPTAGRCGRGQGTSKSHAVRPAAGGLGPPHARLDRAPLEGLRLPWAGRQPAYWPWPAAARSSPPRRPANTFE